MQKSAIVVSALAVGMAAIVFLGCSRSSNSSPTASPSPTVEPSPIPSPERFSRVISGASIPDKAIVAHIPADTSVADREIIRRAMLALPPKKRQDVIWLRVPSGKPRFESLPNHGLVVMYCENCPEGENLPGLYVLYFDGKAQPDSNLIYDSSLDSYLTVVPTGLKYSFRTEE
jgi:hypothetical protein